ncbi:DEAD/DEAH box helicase [Peptococcaceae bacterium]|nr:DEAD/DEAH box helicase [Peptococcaceae bacterium]
MVKTKKSKKTKKHKKKLKAEEQFIDDQSSSQKEWTLDEFQVEAIEAVLNGENVLVAAPTGTGKTLIAEKLAEKALKEPKEIIYTSPLKALSNQKFNDFKKLFGEHNVGLVTGDITINGNALLTVMTTEIFRNKCFEEPEKLKDVVYVVFDEIHYLDDLHRGTAWEEAILFAPLHIKILGLSATVPNIDEIASWISEVRKSNVKVVVEKKRAVPLIINWISPENKLLSKSQAKRKIKKLIKAKREKARFYKYGNNEYAY